MATLQTSWGVWIDREYHDYIGAQVRLYHCTTARNRHVDALFVGSATECLELAALIGKNTQRIATVYSDILEANEVPLETACSATCQWVL